jgi:Carboxypeptidase regulatory-like domain
MNDRHEGVVHLGLWRYVGLCAVCLFIGICASYAQSGKGTINGVVKDPSGAIVPKANVTIANTQTGLTRTVMTGNGGNYVATFLPVGTYKIFVAKSGFKTETRTGITLTTDETASVDFVLQVGATTQSVTVSAGAQMVQTTTAAIGQVVNSRAVVELPLNGRNPAELAFQVPGATNGTRTVIATPGPGSGMPTETAAEVNGSRMGGVYYMLDGVQNMDNYFQSASPFPNSDATQEFRVITNNFDAQYGFASNAVVSVVTKSGTNHWHGDAFEFVRNDKLDAADFFSHVADGLKRNQFGGSIGGPILHDKAFIFGNIQITTAHIKQFSSSTFVPSNDMLNGNFGYLLSKGIQLHNYQGTPYAGDIIPTTDFNPVSLAIENHLPKTSDPAGLVFVPGTVLIENTKEFTIKHDYYINRKNHIMGRAFFQDYNEPAESNQDWLVAHRSWLGRDQNYAGTWTYTPSPTLVNNFSLGYNRVNSETLSGIHNGWQDLGANIVSPDPPNIGNIQAGSGFGWSEINVIQQRHNYDINDTVSLTKGKQLIVAGVDVLTQYSLEQASWLADPLVNFDGSVTGSFYSDFLLGDLSSFNQGGGEFNKYGQVQWAGFGQDTIRLKPNFTLNLGLRWEPSTPPHAIPNTRTAAFWPGHQSSVRYPNAPLGLVFPGDPGVPTGGYPSEYGLFSPRVGIAWQPHFLSNTSVRAAFGLFDVPFNFSFYNHIGSNAPFSPTFLLTPSDVAPNELSVSDPWANFAGTGGQVPFPPFALSNYVPPASAQFILPTTIPAAFTPSFVQAKEQSWNFSIEHQFAKSWLLRTAYVGNEAYHLPTAVDLNPGIFAANGLRTLFPNFGQVLTYQSEGTASYNALQISAQKRFSHGFQFSSNYSWSKELDSSSVGSISNTGSIPDPYNLSQNRGISDLNFTNIWSNMFVWDLPKFKGYRSKWMPWILGNWQVSGIFDYTSGVPFSIEGGNGDNNSLSQQFSDRADLTGQPVNAHQGSQGQWLNQYFNPAAFTFNAPGTFGNSPRNFLTGPAYTDMDMMFAKNIPFKERYRLQFRWEMFNAFNTPYFGQPDTNPSDPSFGQITSTAGPPRIMQIALKLYW